MLFLCGSRISGRLKGREKRTKQKIEVIGSHFGEKGAILQKGVGGDRNTKEIFDMWGLTRKVLQKIFNGLHWEATVLLGNIKKTSDVRASGFMSRF